MWGTGSIWRAGFGEKCQWILRGRVEADDTARPPPSCTQNPLTFSPNLTCQMGPIPHIGAYTKKYTKGHSIKKFIAGWEANKECVWSIISQLTGPHSAGAAGLICRQSMQSYINCKM